MKQRLSDGTLYEKYSVCSILKTYNSCASNLIARMFFVGYIKTSRKPQARFTEAQNAQQSSTEPTRPEPALLESSSTAVSSKLLNFLVLCIRIVTTLMMTKLNYSQI